MPARHRTVPPASLTIVRLIISKYSDNVALVQRWLGIEEDGWGGVSTMVALLERSGQGFGGEITMRIAIGADLA